MSEQPQGPGWWLASDGRYYPPQQPTQQPPQPQPYQQPQYQQPQYQQPQYQQVQPPYQQPHQPQPRGGGCGKVAAIVLVVLVVLGVALSAGAYYAFHWIGDKTSDVVGAGPCQLTSDAVAGKALGVPVTLQKGTGLGGLVSGIIDSRVLANAPSCWGSASVAGSATDGLVVRIALVQGGDTAARFRAEVRQAKGVVVSSSSDGQGGTTTVETGSYYGRAVPGFGDEAFCTTLGGTGTVGVLVREGDRLLYASVGGTTDADAAGLLDEAAGCTRAQTLAKAVLAG